MKKKINKKTSLKKGNSKIKHQSPNTNINKNANNDINITKNGITTNYPHYMIKEIFDTKDSINDLVNNYKTPSDIFNILPSDMLNQIQNICFIACGTSYNAGLVGKEIISKLASVNVQVHTPIEFVLKNTKIQNDTLYFFISQSGTTTDSLIAMEYVQTYTKQIATLTNVKDSIMALNSNFRFYTYAGNEKAVASTKVYSNQIAFMYLFAYAVAISKELIEESIYSNCVINLQQIFFDKNHFNELHNEAKSLVKHINQPNIIAVLGYADAYITAKEVALKFTETSYIPTLYFEASEYLHGPIALIHEKMWHFVLINNLDELKYIKKVVDKIIANNGFVVVVAEDEVLNECKRHFDYLKNENTAVDNVFNKLIQTNKKQNDDGKIALNKKISLIKNKILKGKNIKIIKAQKIYFYKVAKSSDYLHYINMVVAMQLIAYELSVKEGNNPDSPRHLTKSVI